MITADFGPLSSFVRRMGTEAVDGHCFATRQPIRCLEMVQCTIMFWRSSCSVTSAKSTGERCGYLAADKKRVALICAANVALAIVTIARADPVRPRHRRHLRKAATSFRRWRCGRASASSTSSPSCWWRAAPTASPMQRRGERAVRVVRARHLHAACPGTISAARPTRCTPCCARSRRCSACGSNSCASICRRRLRWSCWSRPRSRWTCACRACWWCSASLYVAHRPAGHAQDQGGPGRGRAPLPQRLRACDRLGQQRRRAAELQPHRP